MPSFEPRPRSSLRWQENLLIQEWRAPVKIRTSNLLIRSQMLYPVELRVLGGGLLAEEGKGVKSQSVRCFRRMRERASSARAARARLERSDCGWRENVHCKRVRGCYSFPVMAELIKADQLKTRLKKIPEWELEKKHIERTFEFDDFSESIDFVNGVAEVAEDEEHHPDIDIRYNKVRLILSTHSKGGLTDLDFALAERIDTLAE